MAEWLDIEKLEEIDKSEEGRRRGWEDLVIREGYSQLLLSLVDNHTSAYDHKKGASSNTGPTSQIDLIKGKGRGLIILLHGPPGTGKTSTAETIAAYTGKPLYAITCGDIGVTASEVEHNLTAHTERAESWGCVLLLDEADVFLAKRTWSDMNRNALVSGKSTILK
jgi:SpoVK/Ycf46/Vps4 family AAA+-type ATPase